MLSRQGSWLLFACLGVMVVASGPVLGEPGTGRRTDRHGDPLPKGAVDRLGTTRMRLADEVCAVAFLPDGKTVIAGGSDGKVYFWDTRTGKEVRAMEVNPEGGRVEFAVSPDGNTLAVDQGRSVCLIETVSGRRLRRLEESDGYVGPIAFSPDSKTLATGVVTGPDSAGKKGLTLWDVASGKRLLALRSPGGAVAVAFSPDGKFLAAGDSKGTIRLWSVHHLLVRKGQR